MVVVVKGCKLEPFDADRRVDNRIGVDADVAVVGVVVGMRDEIQREGRMLVEMKN